MEALRQLLGQLSRRDLQEKAKEHGVAANIKSSAIVEQIVEKLGQQEQDENANVNIPKQQGAKSKGAMDSAANSSALGKGKTPGLTPRASQALSDGQSISGASPLLTPVGRLTPMSLATDEAPASDISAVSFATCLDGSTNSGVTPFSANPAAHPADQELGQDGGEQPLELEGTPSGLFSPTGKKHRGKGLKSKPQRQRSQTLEPLQQVGTSAATLATSEAEAQPASLLRQPSAPAAAKPVLAPLAQRPSIPPATKPAAPAPAPTLDFPLTLQSALLPNGLAPSMTPVRIPGAGPVRHSITLPPSQPAASGAGNALMRSSVQAPISPPITAASPFRSLTLNTAASRVVPTAAPAAGAPGASSKDNAALLKSPLRAPPRRITASNDGAAVAAEPAAAGASAAAPRPPAPKADGPTRPASAPRAAPLQQKQAPQPVAAPAPAAGADSAGDAAAEEVEMLVEAMCTKPGAVKLSDVLGMARSKEQLLQLVQFPPAAPAPPPAPAPAPRASVSRSLSSGITAGRARASVAGSAAAAAAAAESSAAAAVVHGVLLYGPRGNAKTMLARAVATECNARCIHLNMDELLIEHAEHADAVIRAAFKLAGQQSPCMLILDKLDTLTECAGQEDFTELCFKIRTELLVGLEDIRYRPPASRRVAVIGIASAPASVDDALARALAPPAHRVYVPLPCPDTREEVVFMEAAKRDAALGVADIEELVKLTEGFSGQDIMRLSGAAQQQAAAAGQQQATALTLEHFKAAAANTRPSLSHTDAIKFLKWKSHLSSLA